MRGTIRLGTIAGIPLLVNPTWFLTFGFITFILGFQVYPDLLDDNSSWVHWSLAIISGLLFFASVVAHELAHSLVARAYGIPVRGITLFVFGGVSHIMREAKRPFSEFLLAVVGPLTSILLSGAFLLAGWLLVDGDSGRPFGALLALMMSLNLGLGIFNLAPGFPMDGGRVLRSALWAITGNYRTATRWASYAGRAMAYSLMAVGGLAAVGLLKDWIDPFGGIWLVLIGLFLENAARQAWTQTQVIESLRQYRAGDLMVTDLATVPADLPVARLSALPSGRAFCLLVTGPGERVIGLFTDDHLRSPRMADAPTVGDAMLHATRATVVAPDDDAATALERMEESGFGYLPVIDDGRIVGVLTRDRLMRLLFEQQRAQVGG
jgi:Zn-dependent protease/CBS domain-containing protein